VLNSHKIVIESEIMSIIITWSENNRINYHSTNLCFKISLSNFHL